MKVARSVWRSELLIANQIDTKAVKNLITRENRFWFHEGAVQKDSSFVFARSKHERRCRRRLSKQLQLTSFQCPKVMFYTLLPGVWFLLSRLSPYSSGDETFFMECQPNLHETCSWKWMGSSNRRSSRSAEIPFCVSFQSDCPQLLPSPSKDLSINDLTSGNEKKP